MPPRFLFFLGGMIAISLLMHFAIQRYAPYSSEVLLPIATLLNGIGYVEIARWDPTTRARPGPVATAQRRGARRDARVRAPRARPRSLPLPDARRGARAAGGSPRPPRGRHDQRRAPLDQRWALSFQPVEFAKILLDLLLRLVLRRQPGAAHGPDPARRLAPLRAPEGPRADPRAWGLSVVILGAENDLGFALLIFALFISLLWVTTGLKSYVLLGLGLLVGGVFIADRAVLPSARTRRPVARPLVRRQLEPVPPARVRLVLHRRGRGRRHRTRPWPVGQHPLSSRRT